MWAAAAGFVQALYEGAQAASQPDKLSAHTLAAAVASGVSYDKIRAVLPEVVRQGVAPDVLRALAQHEDLDT